ncbi:MAG: hypothetical protein V1909_06580 [Candidatus Micrarchaeota archaeon]
MENTLERQWKLTCKAVLFDDVGELGDYEEWLSELKEEIPSEPSYLSGKDIFFHDVDYCKGSRKAAFDEIALGKGEPIKLPEEDDVGELTRAASKIAVYTGSVLLGNSKFVSESTGVFESMHVHDSAAVSNSEYIAHVTNSRFSKMIFGADQIAQSDFVIRACTSRKALRCFEVWQCDNASDCYYSSFLQNCQECMFCFNLIGKRHCIGNVQLTKEKYYELKKKLLGQMCSSLKKNKGLPSLLEVIAGKSPKFEGKLEQKTQKKNNENKKLVEEAFSKTSEIVLGKRLAGLDNFERWLSKYSRGVMPVQSAFTGAKFYTSSYACFLKFPRDRLVTLEEAEWAGGHLSLEESEAESLEFEGIGAKLSKIAYFCAERRSGNNSNLIDCPVAVDSVNCYRNPNCVFTKRKRLFILAEEQRIRVWVLYSLRLLVRDKVLQLHESHEKLRIGKLQGLRGHIFLPQLREREEFDSLLQCEEFELRDWERGSGKRKV